MRKIQRLMVRAGEIAKRNCGKIAAVGAFAATATQAHAQGTAVSTLTNIAGTANTFFDSGVAPLKIAVIAFTVMSGFVLMLARKR
jgi:hypothetical protein